MDKISISVVDDHKLFRNGIVDLIRRFDEYEVISQSGNGKEFIQSLQSGIVPSMVILDIQKVPLADYLPSLAIAPALTWLLR